MRQSRSPLILFVAALIILAIAVAAAILFRQSLPLDPPSPTILNGRVSIERERTRWQEQIKTLGAQLAYEEFKNSNYAVTPGRRHTLIHLWGEVLFGETGIAGVTICDAALGFGCYHGFFTRAITANGIAALSPLDMACRNAFGELSSGCQHGIGHGILEYIGHEKLLAALEMCDAVPQKDPIAGCTAGVFMEYNLPIIIADGEAVMRFRPIDQGKPALPCPNLPARFRQSCYHELVQLWDKYFDYGVIGKFCQAITVPEERRACFMGAGNVAAPSSQYDVAKTLAKCRLMPSPEGVETCRMSSSWSFWASPEHRGQAREPCRGLDASMASECAPPKSL